MARSQAQETQVKATHTPDAVDTMITEIIQREGGYVNHPADKGGPTKYGVTQVTYSRHLGRQATIDDVQKMPLDVAREIYRKTYFDGPGLARLPAEVQPVVFDMAVHSGPKQAIRIVQDAINAAGFGPCKVDGIIGSTTCTRAATAQKEVGDLFNDTIVMKRIEFLESILQRRPRQEVFRKGWMRRAKSFFKRG
jgi:lysozyme family protein